MLAIFKREFSAFFSSPIAYLVIGLFLLLSGLFLWVFGGPFNIPDYGFADLGNFFLLAPWVFLFLIPAITMKSIAEERRAGTIELLLIRPVPLSRIVAGKFLAAFGLVLVALIPTILYGYTLGQLGTTPWNLDTGMLLGSYFGLLFLIANYAAIGIFISALTDNQVVAFLGSLVLCFFFFYGFEAFATLFTDGDTVLFIQGLGMMARVENMARGILDTRDIVYFLSLTLFFLYLATLQLKNLRR